jgi:Transposase DDE domain
MGRRATAGTCLQALVKMAIPLCREAERQCPRTGPGRPPTIPDWVLAVLIMVGVLKRKKTKSSQYRFLEKHRRLLQKWLGTRLFPARSTYFDRYRRAQRLYEEAIRLQGLKAIEEGLAEPTIVAVDKSMIEALGPQWHKKDRQANRLPSGLHGVDCESTWGFSKHDGWVQGYSYEVVVTATAGGTVWPLLASVATASTSEHTTFASKIAQLPKATNFVTADSGYDNNAYGEAVEWTEKGQRTGRRFLCPENRRNAKKQKQPLPSSGQSQRRRRERREFLGSSRGRKIFRRRSQSVEPFNEWFKSLFDLNCQVWHRGLANNQTMILAALFAYQILLRYNHRQGGKNGQVRWILDQL